MEFGTSTVRNDGCAFEGLGSVGGPLPIDLASHPPNALITLIGMPGCGKSTIGRQLARLRQLPFLDADHEIERFIGCSIRDFFEREGEPAFRDIEERVIGELLDATPELESGSKLVKFDMVLYKG